MKVIVNLRDTFSNGTSTKTLENLPAKKLDQLYKLMLNGTVVSIFDKAAQIRYDWVIEEIEEIPNN